MTVLVTGEASGDVLGAGLIRALKTCIPGAHFINVAGPLAQAEGCEAWYEIEELVVTNIAEVLGRLHRLLHTRADLTRRSSELHPDVLVSIDALNFSITLEGDLKKRGVKTTHYASPSVWARRQRRTSEIGRATDLVLAFLLFGKAFYDKFNVPCCFIGHTIADVMSLDPDKDATRDRSGIPYDVRCLALLPGSRGVGVEILSADFLKATQLSCVTYPNLQAIVPLVNAKRRERSERIETEMTPDMIVHMLGGRACDATIAGDTTLLAFGTVALEHMLAERPMVVGYRVRPLTFWLVRRLVKIDYVSLPNPLAGHELVKKLLQDECEPQALTAVLQSLLVDGKTSHEMHETFRVLHQQIRYNADEQTADAVLELAKQR